MVSEIDIKCWLIVPFDGYGSGSGDGYGSGYGSGSGSGYGYGSGYGDGFKSINGERIWYIDGVPTVIRSLRGAIAQGAILDYRTMELKPCYVAKIGSSFAHGKTIHEAVADAQGKEMERVPLEQRIANFLSHHPSLDSTASGHYLYQWHHILTGSCKMGRDEFIRTRGLELDRIYTIREFIDLTKDAYGSAQIRQLAKAYNYDI